MTHGQEAVLRAFYAYGKPMTDTALTVYVHHTQKTPMSSSGIRSRRSELQNATPPLVEQVDSTILKSGRKAAIHALTPLGHKTAEALFGGVYA